MTVQVDVWSDFVCPFCLLGGLSLKQVAQDHDLDIRWHSFELRPAGSPPISPEYLQVIEQKRPMMHQMAHENFGIQINEGPFGIDSRPALIGEKYADAQGLGAAYHERMMEAYWLQGEDISQADVLRQVAARSGLDPDAFMAALDDPQYSAAVDEDVMSGHMIGVNAVPAMVFAERMMVRGAQSSEVLESILDKLKTLA